LKFLCERVQKNAQRWETMSFGPVNGIKVVIARATSKVRELTKSKLKRKSMKNFAE